VKEGAYSGYETDMSAWNKICQATVKGSGNFARTSVPDNCFDPIDLNALDDISFYLTLSSLDIRYTADNDSAGEVISQNEDLELYVGSGVGSFSLTSSTPIFNGRTFNGVIKYKVPQAVKKFLETTFEGGNGSLGSIVTLLAKRDLTITSVDIHLQSLANNYVEIYTREGSSEGHEKSMDGWIQIFNDNVQGKGLNVKTPIDAEQFQSVPILKGQKRSFYITADSPNLRYTNGHNFGQGYTSDDSLVIMEGWGVGKYPLSFDSPIFKPRVFNGNFYYE